MYTYKNFFIILFFSLLFVSCSDLLFPELNINDVNYNEFNVTISFSQEVDEDSVQKSISLLEDGASVTGYFKCNGNQVYFFPKNGIRKNFDYDLTVNTTCEDRKGNSLTEDYHLSFSTREEHIRPQVLSILPNNQDTIDSELKYIDIIFSETISRESFINALTINPSFDFFLEFYDEDSAVKILPKNPLTLNTDYVITINTDLSDLSRNTLLENVDYMFYYNKKNILPEYTVSAYDSDENFVATLNQSANINNIPTNCSIRVDFEHKMDLSAVSAYFYFTPMVDYKINKDEIDGKYVIFTLNGAQWNTKYTLTVLSGLPDIYGQRFENIDVYSFITDNELNNPPCFVEGIIQTSDWAGNILNESVDYNYMSEEKNYSTISLSDEYVAGLAKKTQAYLVFYTSNLSEGIDIYSLREGVSVSTTNSCCSIVIKTIDRIDYNSIPSNISDLFSSEINSSSRKKDYFSVILEITNTSKSGEIHFVFDKDIKDSLNNNLDRKYDFILNK